MEVKAWPDETSAKLSVHELPQVWAPIPADGGVLVSDAGRFARVLDGEAFRYLAFVEFLPGRTRGNHYHHAKQELLYITDGRLLAYYVDIDTGRSLELTLGAGHVIRTGPRLAHAYHALEVAHAIEISVQPFDASDTVPYEVYPISDDPRIGREATELARELQLKDRIDASHRRAPVTSGGTGRAGRAKGTPGGGAGWAESGGRRDPAERPRSDDAEPTAVSQPDPADGTGPAARPPRVPKPVSGARPSARRRSQGHDGDEVAAAPTEGTDRPRRRGGAR